MPLPFAAIVPLLLMPPANVLTALMLIPVPFPEIVPLLVMPPEKLVTVLTRNMPCPAEIVPLLPPEAFALFVKRTPLPGALIVPVLTTAPPTEAPSTMIPLPPDALVGATMNGLALVTLPVTVAF